jgi:hypothetical protein
MRLEQQTPRYGDSWLFSSFANTLWGTTLVASIITLTLWDGDHFEFYLSAVAVVALLIVYVALTPKTNKALVRFLPDVDIEEDTIPLAVRTISVLLLAFGVQTCMFGFDDSMVTLATLFLGLMKALVWYCVTRAVSCPYFHRCHSTSMVLTRSRRLAIPLGASHRQYQPLALCRTSTPLYNHTKSLPWLGSCARF